MNNVFRLLRLAVTGFALAVTGTALWAQAYPSKPIRLVIPWPTGGGADTLGRPIAQRLSERLGQPVVVENRSGAAGSIGAAMVAQAPADGYTLLLNYLSDSAINPHLYDKVGYDPLKDFTPLTEIARGTFVLVVHPSLGIKSVQDLVALARAKPGELTYGSAGNGSLGHLAGAMFSTMSGLKLSHIPYKGSGPLLTDMLAGRLTLTFADATVALPHVAAGKLVALGVTSARRSPVAPDLPTIAEAGVPGYEAVSWWGFVGPAGLPEDIVQRLNTELVTVLRTPEMQERIAKLGAQVIAGRPAEFMDHIRQENVRWAKVIKDSGARVE